MSRMLSTGYGTSRAFPKQNCGGSRDIQRFNAAGAGDCDEAIAFVGNLRSETFLFVAQDQSDGFA